MKKYMLILIVLLSTTLGGGLLFAEQIVVPRIEQMPNFPQPYHMRDWKQVAINYDEFVFDFEQSGQYLPLISWRTNTVNYPEHDSFNLHTVVGTPYPTSSEAINALPAVIGATLVGIDKSDQDGHDWVLMCEEWFNNRPEENVYLNHPVTSSGSDWWYDTMPNVFFYQLYDYRPYPGTFTQQFVSVADQWLTATVHMGGSSTPWDRPYMNYRGWYLETMTPNANGVPEPEAAGAIGWLLYMAYKQTGNEDYRIGAEWAMEYLNARSGNPSYELQLAYGTYIAARMNAELMTGYDLEKMVNWCFDVGPLRNWGAIVGNWGGYDVSGLIGEVSGNDYAFAMNTFEQIGALVPLVRYDDRYARAIGKWVLNASNASRLFYPNYLPDENQDSEEWAHIYDPNSTIAHEAIREEWNGISPYATGDAMAGGWGETNLTLYGSSHVGILGGIIDTTNVPGILQLDVLKTDYFRDAAYPTYLYYNPYDIQQQVVIDVGDEPVSLYDAVSNSFITDSVNGTTNFTIFEDTAMLLVLTPPDQMELYYQNGMTIGGIYVDYELWDWWDNFHPRIKALAAETQPVIVDETVMLYCTAHDLDEDPLTYNWTASGGSISGEGSEVEWTAPSEPGLFELACQVDDGEDQSAFYPLEIEVVTSINNPPVIADLSADPRKMNLGATSTITCLASDADADTLSYTWSADAGIFSGEGTSVTWQAPMTAGDYELTCLVDDGHTDGQAEASLLVRVRDFSQNQTGELIAFYPFSGSAEDASGNGHHGTVSGATLVNDRHGTPNSAYYFDGVNDQIQIPNHEQLNFREGISVSYWMNIGTFFDRESYPLSHGNWENRWKVSLSNQRLRWTIKTDYSVNGGIKDLDSEAYLETDMYYHVVVRFDGADMEIYLNGELAAMSTWQGLLRTTTIDPVIGQSLPGNTQWGFKGVLDDIRIYDYGLSMTEIEALYQDEVGIEAGSNPEMMSRAVMLLPAHPNPFTNQTTIQFQLPTASRVSVRIYNSAGQRVRQILADDIRAAGVHHVTWNGRNEADVPVGSGVYLVQLKTDNTRSVQKVVRLEK